jgi:hypothetical protein
MRTAERKIPPALLNAICRREELAFMQANDATKVPSKEKKRIKDDAIEKNLRKMPPGINGVQMAIDRAANILYVGTGSTGQLDNFLAFFFKTTEIEPVQITIDEILGEKIHDIPSVSFSDDVMDQDFVPARDFLTWLWYFSEEDAGKVSHPQFGDFEVMIEGPLTLAFSSEVEAKGSCETTIKKGNPLRSAEAKAALKVGKKLKKAKLTLVRAQEAWKGTFDADKFCFSGLSLPEGEEMERDSVFQERINFLNIFREAVEMYVKKYVDTIMAEDWMETEKKIRKWVQERDSY